MKIIIAGAGEVGFYLARQLANDEYDITVIDKDQQMLERVDTAIDALTVLGSSSSIDTLKRAGVKNADIFVSVTNSESVNVNSAMLAKKMGAQRTILRVSNGEYVSEENKELFRSLGFDHLIYPEELAAQEIVKLIERAAATDILEFEGGKLSLVGLRVDDNAPVLKKTMREISEVYSNVDFRIAAIYRGLRTIIPAGNDVVLPNDQIFVITNHKSIGDVLGFSGMKKKSINRIMILGGGKVGRKAARMLEDKLEVKIIESDKNKSMDLADYLEKSLVIRGDGRDIDLLAQEGIIDMDAFISVTDDAETNIITCLMAKHLQVPKTIALVDKADYVPLTQTIGLDSLINKKLITANNITSFIRRSNIVSIATLQGIDAEVMEYFAKPGSKITKMPVKNLKFPKNAIIGGVIRGDDGMVTVGDTQIMPNDKVVVFALPGAIKDIEKYFN